MVGVPVYPCARNRQTNHIAGPSYGTRHSSESLMIHRTDSNLVCRSWIWDLLVANIGVARPLGESTGRE